MKRSFFLVILIFCCSLVTRAGAGKPEQTFRFFGVNIEKMMIDSVPANHAPAPENKDAVIKEVPKARKQIKPLDLEKTPVVRTIVKPIIKPVIKPVIRPVIKPIIRIH